MSKSVEILRQYLETEYIHNVEMGSPDMSSAIRDILTDLIHISKAEDVEIGQRLEDALDVYYQEYQEAQEVQVNQEDELQPAEPLSTNLIALLNDDDEVIRVSGVAIEGVGIYSTEEKVEVESNPYDGGFSADGTCFGCHVDATNRIILKNCMSKYKVGQVYPEVLEVQLG
jgi:hypothetical protein